MAVPLDGLEPLKRLAAFQVRFSACATFAGARVGLAFVSRDRLSTGAATEGDARGGAQHMTDGLARGLALSSKPPLRAFTATRRHPLAPTGSRGPTPAPG